VLAIADQLIEQAMAGLEPHACWVETVTDGVRRMRRTYCDHPAAASLAACRTTQRPAEMRIVDTLIGAVLDAGFEGAEAARVYRAIGDFTLAWAGWEAAFLALDPGLQENDQAAWARAYRAVGRARHPHIWQLRDQLPDVTDDDVFETVLSLLVGGLLQMAPHPCDCHPCGQ
jgi:Tetracyclin repressor-like, C-terminal domain